MCLTCPWLTALPLLLSHLPLCPLQLLDDRYFSQHARYLIKELRILAYAQNLEAYRSVVLASMAASFGVSVPFLDAELSRFIAAGRLNAQIDKVLGAYRL